ncbi:DNA topoisomerase [Heyndrickxia ginsengihumi]|uniref:DNA topoisomerase n=1 Tax=Heyndrickxia ginsengihumi TaxID=363870 RepID=UPI001E54AAB9|nr:DNA topoisomerase [Heyndrickxia ginsengihumi]
MELFVCEKPSQAETFGKALSGSISRKQGYFVGKDGRIYTHAFGHLVSAKMPDEINPDWGWKGPIEALPFFIENIPLRLIDDPGIKKQYKIIVDLMNKADTIICSTDAGREGQHIFMKILKLSGIKNKNVMRLWVRNMTESGIKKAYAEMKKNDEYIGMTIAGQLREESDMIIGLNATQLLTKLSGSPNVLSLGRVQTPVLAMIVNRDEQIENFTKETFFTVIAPIKQNSSKYFEMVLEKDERLTKDLAEKRKMSLNLLNRKNFKIEKKNISQKPHNLFSLTTLQRYMNKYEGWSSDQTLKTLQQLYENKNVTYPRTESEYIASDEDIKGILQAHKGNEKIQSILEHDWSIESSFICPDKVTDHEAIIPTTNVPDNLSKDEEKLYNAIFLRFVQSFYPHAEFEQYKATFADSEHSFVLTDKVLVKPGFLALEGKKVNESEIKNLKLADIGEYQIKEKETKPPVRYTEDTLLRDMVNVAKLVENTADKNILKKVEGIGTPATRSSIIKLLKKRNFIEEVQKGNKKAKELVSTKLGRNIIHTMPTNFSLYSPVLTALLESKLSAVELGSLSKSDYYVALKEILFDIASELRNSVKKLDTNLLDSKTKEVIATCPKCGKEVFENKKGYSCSGYKDGCKVTIWKNGLEKLGKKNITKTEAKKLLQAKTIKVKLTSKAGKSYEKNVKFDLEKNWIVFAD